MQEVELTGANSDYAHVKLPIGREIPVSIRHLATKGDTFLPGYDVEYIDEN